MFCSNNKNKTALLAVFFSQILSTFYFKNSPTLMLVHKALVSRTLYTFNAFKKAYSTKYETL